MVPPVADKNNASAAPASARAPRAVELGLKAGIGEMRRVRNGEDGQILVCIPAFLGDCRRISGLGLGYF
jgi:hypothetical protein